MTILMTCAMDSASTSAWAGGVCSAAPSWSADVAFATGAIVTHRGKTYRCVQGHTSLSVWPPEIVPALWAETNDCGAPPPTASATPTAPASLRSTMPSRPWRASHGQNHRNATEYAPYFYTWGWGNPAYAFTGLVDLKNKSGLSNVTLAFVLASNGCNTSRDVHEHQSDVDAFRRAGGHVKASFGGANGAYLESACADAGGLAKALGAFVDATGIADLDFDVEQSGAMTPSINERRSAAFASLQAAKSDVRISLTLAALPRDRWGVPGGLSAPALDVVKSAVAAGVRIHRVNLMTMDYGPYYSLGGPAPGAPRRSMSELAESALIDANAQLRSAIPGLTEEGAFAMLGATPMIGANDVSGEVFTIEDAKRLTSFAKERRLGLVSFWAINRDQACKTGLALCSGVNEGTFDFHDVFKTLE